MLLHVELVTTFEETVGANPIIDTTNTNCCVSVLVARNQIKITMKISFQIFWVWNINDIVNKINISEMFLFGRTPRTCQTIAWCQLKLFVKKRFVRWLERTIVHNLRPGPKQNHAMSMIIRSGENHGKCYVPEAEAEPPGWNNRYYCVLPWSYLLIIISGFHLI